MTTALFSEIDQLRQENKFLQFKIEELIESNRLLMENCALLKEQLEWFKRQLFGQKSERFISGGSEEPYLPGLEPTEEETEEETILVPAHEKRKAKSTLINTISFPDDLPKETKILDLTEEEKIDSKTGKTLVCIGEEISRKLAMKASVYFIKEIIRKKYAVPGDADQGIKIASMPDSIIPRCAVEESFLADVITKKFCDHLPLYRQAEIRTRDNIYVSKQTLSSYVIRAGDALKPLYDLLEETIKASGNVFTDETPVDVLAPGTGKTKQGYMTVMVGGASLNPALRVYRFLSSRKHDDVMDWFTDYKGVFHSDKYQAYEKLAKEKDKTPDINQVRL